MKKLTKVIIIAVLLLATVGTGVALAGYNKAGARKRMIELAHWKAACGQGYWECADGLIVHGPYGPAHADPEWAGTVILFRHKKGSESWQTCNVEIGINHDKSTEELTAHCFYDLQFARDRPDAASWSRER